ncbi:MAG: hypothetical protein ABI790_06460 [Betaproteobacteria bacterium]
MRTARPFSGRSFLIVLAGVLSLASCATPGVTKATGRVTDPPVELVLYCLLFPTDPACRGILK